MIKVLRCRTKLKPCSTSSSRVLTLDFCHLWIRCIRSNTVKLTIAIIPIIIKTKPLHLLSTTWMAKIRSHQAIYSSSRYRNRWIQTLTCTLQLVAPDSSSQCMASVCISILFKVRSSPIRCTYSTNRNHSTFRVELGRWEQEATCICIRTCTQHTMCILITQVFTTTPYWRARKICTWRIKASSIKSMPIKWCLMLTSKLQYLITNPEWRLWAMATHRELITLPITHRGLEATAKFKRLQHLLRSRAK